MSITAVIHRQHEQPLRRKGYEVSAAARRLIHTYVDTNYVNEKQTCFRDVTDGLSAAKTSLNKRNTATRSNEEP